MLVLRSLVAQNYGVLLNSAITRFELLVGTVT